MSLLHRKSAGQPIRDSMERAGLSIPALARATQEVDPAGKGVSAALIGRLVATGTSERERCRLRNAWYIAEALHDPLQKLFAMPEGATSTVERSADAEEG